jgi:hypothetical protein
MLLFGSVRMNAAYLYRSLARVKTTCGYGGAILRHFTRTVQINNIQVRSGRFSELVRKSKSKRERAENAQNYRANAAF